MRKLFIVALVALFALALLVSCGEQKEAEETSAAGHPDEVADTTRLDSMAAVADSVVDEAVEEGTEAAEEAVKDATGH